MERMTIDVGIDLGTTTSCIAVLEGVNPRVIRNNESAEFTPSAVSYDKKSRIHIGNIAKNQLLSSDKNERHDVSLAFKRNMGQPGPFITFKVNDKQMTPIELSAEMLKELRNDAKRNLGQEILAAAISIPAAFESPQSTATDRAAGLAGFSLCPLIQEPVAAALTYGFQTKSDRVFWMIYDFGGGTFDAAIMQVRDEQIQVVNHGGDNRLGGGDIDKAIVEKLLIPEINKECRLSDADWKELLPSLMYLTEKQKIPLSIEQEADIEIPEHILHGGYERTIKRSEIETLAEPFIERSIEICKQVLQEKRLTPSDIEKLILVGGPTLMPIFREMLTYKLGIALESKENPITVVARGAAIFAGNQLNTKKAKGDKPVSIPGKFSIELDYQPIGDETEPLIGGKVTSFKDQSFQGFNIEFADSRTGWRSGMISLSADGKFIADIHAERDCTNNYLIELKDPQGSLCDVIPNSFNYTVGRTIVNQIMTHNISIALANNEAAVFFSKGDPLPNKKVE
jgi:molecular chaperone DnaK